MSITPAILSGMVVGVSLGFTGGGGSILAVPLLVGVLGLALRDAVAVSLAVVGFTAFYGAVLQRQQVRWGAGGLLGLGGILGAPLGAFLGAKLPDTLTLALFAALMVVIAVMMWRGGQSEDVPLAGWACQHHPDGNLRFHWTCAGKLGLAGAMTGILSGIFGVGGGFLVVPALLLVTAMPMPAALATSLVSIFLISAAAFTANALTLRSLPLLVAAWFLVGGAIGMTGGAWFKKFLPALALRRVFAVVLGVVALWVGSHARAEEASTAPSRVVQILDREDLASKGRAASAALFGNLMARLAEAMAQGGAAEAVKVCQTEALLLTGQTAKSLREQGIASIRRIGVRTRNPKNLKDFADREMLERFLASWESRRAAPPAGQIVKLPESGEIRYYQPVPVAASCLACHGSGEDIAAETRAILRRLYPEDEAVGFSEGDLRGAIVVTFPDDAGRPEAR